MYTVHFAPPLSVSALFSISEDFFTRLALKHSFATMKKKCCIPRELEPPSRFSSRVFLWLQYNNQQHMLSTRRSTQSKVAATKCLLFPFLPKTSQSLLVYHNSNQRLSTFMYDNFCVTTRCCHSLHRFLSFLHTIQRQKHRTPGPLQGNQVVVFHINQFKSSSPMQTLG